MQEIHVFDGLKIAHKISMNRKKEKEKERNLCMGKQREIK